MEHVTGEAGAPLATAAAQTTGNASLASMLAELGLPTTPTAIIASDATDTSMLTSKGLLVSAGGTLAVRGTGAPATTVSITVVAGQYVPLVCSRVMAATTATVVGLA